MARVNRLFRCSGRQATAREACDAQCADPRTNPLQRAQRQNRRRLGDPRDAPRARDRRAPSCSATLPLATLHSAVPSGCAARMRRPGALLGLLTACRLLHCSSRNASPRSTRRSLLQASSSVRPQPLSAAPRTVAPLLRSSRCADTSRLPTAPTAAPAAALHGGGARRASQARTSSSSSTRPRTSSMRRSAACLRRSPAVLRELCATRHCYVRTAGTYLSQRSELAPMRQSCHQMLVSVPTIASAAARMPIAASVYK
jgi:hypothetical protein